MEASERRRERTGITRRDFMVLSALGTAGAGVIAIAARKPAHAASDDAEGLIAVSIDDVIESDRGDYGVVVLKDIHDRYLPIWVGAFEAQAIRLGNEGVQTPRPLTHDFMRGLLEATGAEPNRVIITQLRKMTYFAQFIVVADGEERAVDSRPSDALALAVRTGAPIFVSQELMERSGIAEDELQQVEPADRA